MSYLPFRLICPVSTWDHLLTQALPISIPEYQDNSVASPPHLTPPESASSNSTLPSTHLTYYCCRCYLVAAKISFSVVFSCFNAAVWQHHFPRALPPPFNPVFFAQTATVTCILSEKVVYNNSSKFNPLNYDASI